MQSLGLWRTVDTCALGGGSPHRSALIAHPEAVRANRRYMEVDLNRCFLGAELADGERYNTLEHRRARELDALLGP
eukprot:COSAG01_NODE_1905_length_8940_cov_19.008936_2_plen_76_part_00